MGGHRGHGRTFSKYVDKGDMGEEGMSDRTHRNISHAEMG